MKLLALLSIFVASFTFGQKAINVTVQGNIFNVERDSVFISQYFGTHYVDYLRGRLDKKGNYKLQGTLQSADYYVLRLGNQHINIVLRDSSHITINADGKNIVAYKNISGSQESVALNDFIAEMQRFNFKKDSCYKALQANPQNSEEINKYFQNEYFQFATYRQRFIGQNTNSAALLPLLSTLDPEKEYNIFETVCNQLAVGFPQSPSVQNTLMQFQQLKAQHEKQQFLSSGKPAPNFTQNDLNGNPISLSDLKGKVVLLDFWASWCGPCRKENPNVVNLYKKYKDAGFTVMSVSLDKEANLWKAAIEKDGLIWPNHVSDLKFWQNEVAKLYQVSSIPFTVLIDQNGNIIDTNLRGPALEQALMTIFGF